MSERINQYIENKEIHKLPEVQVQAAPKAADVPVGKIPAGSSNGGKVDKLNLQTEEQLQAELKELLENSGRSEEDCQNDIENFQELSTREKIEAVKKLINDEQTESVNNSESIDNSVTETSQFTKFGKFDKKEYNNKTLSEKIEQVKFELAKNIYINGSGGIKGSDGKPVPAHGREAWNKLSDKEKNAFLNQIMTFINKHEDLKNKFEELQHAIQSGSDDEKYLAEATVDHLMNVIQTSNAAEENVTGISVIDFLKKSDNEKTQAIYGYIGGLEAQNENDTEYIKRQDTLKAEVLKIKNSRESDSSKHSTGLEFDEAVEYMKYNNLNEKEILYNAYKKIPEQERTKPQELLVKHYEEFVNTKNGKAVSLLEKVANYDKLKTEYQQLINKQDKTQEDKNHLRLLTEYLNSDDAKELEKYRNDIPKPQGKFEEQIAEDGAELKNTLSNAENSNTKINTLQSIKYIEDKIQQYKTPEEKAKYIATFIKLNPSSEASEIYSHYHKKLPELQNYDLTVYEAGEVANMSEDKFKSFSGKTAELSKGNDLQKVVAQETLETTNRNLQKCKGAKYDAHKRIHVNMVSNDFSYTSDENAQRALNGAFDVTTTIVDKDIQGETTKTIIKSKHMNSKTSVHIVDNGWKLQAENQVLIKPLFDKYVEPAKHLSATDGLIAKYDKSAQTEIFKGTHASLNKWLDGEDLVKYSKSLANQISSCHKDNQLDMHKEIMTSSSSEVRTYAAGNIKNYDMSVQANAIEATVATGDTNAIASAYSNTNPVIQEEAGMPKIIENAYTSGNTELSQKIKSGATLTAEEYESLTEEQKQQYKQACFLALPPAKQVQLISSVSDINTKKKIYKIVAETNPEFLKTIIESNASTAEFIYDMHIADNLVLSAAKRKGGNDIGFAMLAQKIEKINNKKSEIKSSEQKVLQTETAKKDSTRAQIRYADNPLHYSAYSALKDKKNPNIYKA